MDVSMPKSERPGRHSSYPEALPQTEVLILSQHEYSNMRQALGAGALGYVLIIHE